MTQGTPMMSRSCRKPGQRRGLPYLLTQNTPLPCHNLPTPSTTFCRATTRRACRGCLSAAALGSDWVELDQSTVRFRNPADVGRRLILTIACVIEMCCEADHSAVRRS